MGHDVAHHAASGVFSKGVLKRRDLVVAPRVRHCKKRQILIGRRRRQPIESEYPWVKCLKWARYNGLSEWRSRRRPVADSLRRRLTGTGGLRRLLAGHCSNPEVVSQMSILPPGGGLAASTEITKGGTLTTIGKDDVATRRFGRVIRGLGVNA